jgi:hypothetical protein
MGERAHTPGAATCPIAAAPNMFEALLQGARLLERMPAWPDHSATMTPDTAPRPLCRSNEAG